MSQLAAMAELDKLARLSGLAREEIDSLQVMRSTQIRELRRALSEQLFQIDERLFRRLARLANRIPSRLLAWLACHQFGPVITARVAGLMTARRAVLVARQLPAEFLADISLHLDPRYARDVLSQLPAGQIVPIVHVLITRGEFLTIGRFVDYLADDRIQAVIDSVPEEEHLVRIAYYMESKNRLDHVMRMMPRERLRRALLLVLEPERGLMLQLMSLVFHTSYDLQHELGELAAEQDESVLNEIVRATQQHGLWGDLLPVIAILRAETQQMVVNLPILRDASVLESILEAADRQDLWRAVLPLVSFMQEPMREAVARIAARLPREALQRVANGALMGEMWRPLVDIVVRMPAPKQTEIAEILHEYDDVDPDLWQRLQLLASEHGLGEVFSKIDSAW